MTSSLVAGPAPAAVSPTPLVLNGASASSAGPSFGDIMDAVNPLQHIPVISSIYRAATGSQISAGSQIAGDTLYGVLLPGGAIASLASSVADVAVKAVSGKSIAGNVISALTPSSSASAPAATPLVPATTTATPATTTAAQTPIAPIPLSSHAAHSQNSQYQRAQMHDFINSRLVKMAV